VSVSGSPVPAGPEPRATIYVPAWLDARARLQAWRGNDGARAILASAMEQVESGWEPVRAVQRVADMVLERDRRDDDYGTLLTFGESEFQETYRSMAVNLAAWVDGWPGRALPSTNDPSGYLSEFCRYAKVLVLATGAAMDIPDRFRAAVREVARLLPSEEWARRLSETFAAIEELSAVEMAKRRRWGTPLNNVRRTPRCRSTRSRTEITADTARQAVKALLSGLPEPVQERSCGMLVADVAGLYASADQTPPPWLDVLSTYFAAPVDGRDDADTSARADRQ
jgi:hypothetical protein